MQQDNELISAGRSVIELRKPAKSITQVELEARAAGLTYGKYLAGYRADQELAELARKREAERRERERVEEQYRKRHKRGPSTNRKRVVMMDAACQPIQVFESQSEAAEKTGVKQCNISVGCKRFQEDQESGKLRKCRSGVRWRYATDED